jgi:HEPN domain-containing protein
MRLAPRATLTPSPMQSDRHLTARYWLETARDDLIVAGDYAERLPHIACFHAQQAAETALKAVLTELIGDAPRTHVAHELIAELTADECLLSCTRRREVVRANRLPLNWYGSCRALPFAPGTGRVDRFESRERGRGD